MCIHAPTHTSLNIIYPVCIMLIHMYIFSFGINYSVNDSFFEKTNLTICYNS